VDVATGGLVRRTLGTDTANAIVADFSRPVYLAVRVDEAGDALAAKDESEYRRPLEILPVPD
jgi:hypothetical protein